MLPIRSTPPQEKSDQALAGERLVDCRLVFDSQRQPRVLRNPDG
jgi:hypothetical protein